MGWLCCGVSPGAASLRSGRDGDPGSPTRPARSGAEIRYCAAIASVVDGFDAKPVAGAHVSRSRTLRRVQRGEELNDLPVELHCDEAVAICIEARDRASFIAHHA